MKTLSVLFRGKAKVLSLLLISLCTSIFNAQSFQDNLGTEQIGSQPSKWNVIKGGAEVRTQGKDKIIYLTNYAIIAPKIEGENYLSSHFTLNFDAYFDTVSDNEYYEIRFWSSENDGTISNETTHGFYRPLRIYKNGAWVIGSVNNQDIHLQINTKTLDSNESTWRSCMLEYNNENLKISIDGVSIINIPNFKYLPEMISIGAIAYEYNGELLRAIKNVNISGLITESSSTLVNNTTTATDLSNTTNQNTDGIAGTLPENITNIDANTTPIADSGILAATCTGLEALDEGNGRGWRLKGRPSVYYGNIGLNAVDLSFNKDPKELYNYTSCDECTGALGKYSFAFGYQSSSSGDFSVAIGSATSAEDFGAIAIGGLVWAKGTNSIALGTSVKSAEINSCTIGYFSEALGKESFSIGYKTKAEADNSMAIGYETEASAKYSLAMGHATKAKGDYSTAMGNSTEAEGKNSLAVGIGTKAIGKNSVAMGRYTETITPNSLVIGKYNNHSGYDHILFEIGCGIDATRRANAFSIYDNGDGVMAGKLNQVSDKRLKTNISDLRYGLNTVLKLRPVSFNWKRYPEQAKKSLGLIAQEVQPLIDEIVNVGKDKNKTLSVSYIELVPVLIKAIQEQQAIIEQQNNDIKSLQSEANRKDQTMESLSKRLEWIELVLKTEDKTPAKTE